MGQVYQGRVGKGLLFFFGLYLLFFYGMWMGQWRNVWLPDVSDMPQMEIGGTSQAVCQARSGTGRSSSGQFWIGIAAWPAVVAVHERTTAPRTPGRSSGSSSGTPTEEELNELQRNASKRWDLGWVYTVIAGVLNLLVIYDALAGPMFRDPPKGSESKAADEPRPHRRRSAAAAATRAAVPPANPTRGTP